MKEYGITNPTCYIISVVFFVLIIRCLLCVLKAWGIKNGEINDKEGNCKYEQRDGPFWRRWGDCFKGFYLPDKNIDDHWLPAMIGFCELSAYPVLMQQGKWYFIGAWIGVKTASQWGGWSNNRNAYNRFLLANILALSASFFFLTSCLA